MKCFFPAARSCDVFSRTAPASLTVNRPFSATIVTPSRSESRISRLIGLFQCTLCRAFGIRFFGLLRARRQQNREARAFADSAGHFDAPAVHFDDPRHEAQPEPEPRLRAGGTDAIEAVENVGQIFR